MVSPLRPHEVIAYDRLVILEYDSEQERVTILGRLPEDVLSRGNFDIRTDKGLETNWSLLPRDVRE